MDQEHERVPDSVYAGDLPDRIEGRKKPPIITITRLGGIVFINTRRASHMAWLSSRPPFLHVRKGVRVQ